MDSRILILCFELYSNTIIFCCTNYSNSDFWQLFHVDSILFIGFLSCFLLFLLYLFLFVSQSLTFWYSKIHQADFVFSMPSHRTHHSSCHLCSFYWRTVLEPESWMLGVLSASGLLLSPASFSIQSQKIYEFILLMHIHTYLYMFLYLSVCIYK